MHSRNRLSLLILSSRIHLPQSPSWGTIWCDDASTQKPFFQPKDLSTSNKCHFQLSQCDATSTSGPDSETRSLLLFSCKKPSPQQGSTTAQVALISSHQLSSYNSNVSFLSQEETEDTPCGARARKITFHQQSNDINSTIFLRGHKHLCPPASEKHSTDHKPHQLRSAWKKAPMKNYLKIFSSKNQYIFFRWLWLHLLPFAAEQYCTLNDALISGKILVDAPLLKDTTNQKRITSLRNASQAEVFKKAVDRWVWDA